MSGVCGIINFDGAPVDPALLEKMAQAAAYRGPDGIHYWIEGNVGLAHLALHTTPESLRERQPLRSARGDLTLVADARIDNRDELMPFLASKGLVYAKDADGNTPTDVDLILAAYECWGEDCPKHLIGDFAFVVWDDRYKQLYCAVDPLAVRQLFYARDGLSFYVCSAIGGILTASSTFRVVRESAIVDFLCWRFDDCLEHTFYQGVERVQSSTSLLVGMNSETKHKYWDFLSQEEVKYKSDEEYVLHFRDLFFKALRVRLRSIGPIGISVSGGFDSSSIACTLNQLYRSERTVFPDIRLYSYVFSKFPAADERYYLDEVIRWCDCFSATRLDGHNEWGFKESGLDGGFPLDEPDIFSIRSMLAGILRQGREDGCKVMLTGEGGDQVLMASAYSHPELLKDLDFRSKTREIMHFWRHNRWNIGYSLLKRFIPHVLKNPLKKLLHLNIIGTPTWIKSKWLISLEKTNAEQFSRKNMSYSSQIILHSLGKGWYAYLLSYLNIVSSTIGTEYRLPYLDRDLVSFLLNIPDRLRFKDGKGKYILRLAMKDVLPGAVLNRISYAHFSEVLDYGIRERERMRVEKLLLEVASTQSKYLDFDALMQTWNAYFDDPTVLPKRVQLAPIQLQIWYNAWYKRKNRLNRNL